MIAVREFELVADGRARLIRGHVRQFVHAALDEGLIRVWAEVDTEATSYTRWLAVYQTGEALPLCLGHVASVTTPDGQAWHVYEVVPPRGKP